MWSSSSADCGLLLVLQCRVLGFVAGHKKLCFFPVCQSIIGDFSNQFGPLPLLELEEKRPVAEGVSDAPLSRTYGDRQKQVERFFDFAFINSP